MISIFNVLKRRKFNVLLFLLGLNILYGLEAFFHPLLIKWIFDEALGNRSLKRFGFLVLGYLSLTIIVNIGHLLMSLWRKREEIHIIETLELQELKWIFQADLLRIRQLGQGYVVSRIHRDVQEAVSTVFQFLSQTTTQFTSSIAFGIVMFYISWKASLILLFVTPALVIYGRRVGRRIQSLTALEREAEAEWIKVLSNSIESIHWLQIFPFIMHKALALLQRTLRIYLRRVFQIHRHIETQHSVNNMTMGLSDVFSMTVGAFFVFKGEITFGGYLAFVNAFWRSVQSVVSMISQMSEYHRLKGIEQKLLELVDTFPTHNQHTISICPSGGIHLRDVCVRVKEKCILNVPEFSVKQGEKVLVVGPNGSGKTTLIHVITGNILLSRGEVCRPEQTVALIQPVNLPPLQIKELIPASVAHLTGVSHLLHRYPYNLSMGEKIRVALSIILFSDASCILLDEPLSNLDSEMRQEIPQLVAQYTAGKTLLIVSHQENIWRTIVDRVVPVEKINFAYK